MSDYLIMKAVEYDKLPVKFKKAHPFEGLLDEGYWLQKKYDGCMGIATIRPDFDECRMQSRTGEDYTASTGHLLREMFDTLVEHEGEGFMPVIFIGEVWQPISEAKFPAISGKFRRQSPSPELRFVVNDMLPLGFNTDIPYHTRWSDAKAILGDSDPRWKVQMAETFGPSQLAMMNTTPRQAALAWQEAGGFDGAILRNPDAGYTVGTVKAGEIIKVKPVMALDLEVVGVRRGTGDKTGRDVWTIEVLYKGEVSVVGSGVPHEEAAVPGPGQIAEIECLGITEDGKLREPRFKGIRHDKLKPD